MNIKKLCYIGETTDYSDRWLINELSKRFAVKTVTPISFKHKEQLSGFDIIINRLYTSTANRYGMQVVTYLINKLKKCESAGDIVINSSKGYLIDLDRLKQYDFFRKHNIPFVPILTLAQARTNPKFISQPVVLKLRTSGRNKYLTVAREINSLSKFVPPNQMTEMVVQPLIKNKTCYRTECIGDLSITFQQKINIHRNRLSFVRIPKVIKPPMPKELISRIIKTLNKIGVQIFSIEYFVINSMPHIVDFNLTSNYMPFLICAKGAQIKRAWLETIDIWASIKK